MGEVERLLIEKLVAPLVKVYKHVLIPPLSRAVTLKEIVVVA